jgi:hypothetical protein
VFHLQGRPARSNKSVPAGPRWLSRCGEVELASIEVNRRQGPAKSDGLGETKLVEMLIRLRNGERKVWKLVRVPSVANEDQRQLHRELRCQEPIRRRAACAKIGDVRYGRNLYPAADGRST